MVWIHFPGMGLEFWNEEILFKICKELGTPVKVDNATINCEVGYYANVLVEVDFSKSIPNKIWIGTKYGGFFQDILIPDCPKFCSTCKIIGHLVSECRVEKAKNQSVEKTNQQRTRATQQRAKGTMVPFDICNSSAEETSHTIKMIQGSTSNSVENHQQQSAASIISSIATLVTLRQHNNSESLSTCSRFKVLTQDDKIDEDNLSVDEEIIVDIEPQKLIHLAETTELDKIEVKFVNGGSGKVTTEPVAYTTWVSVLNNSASQISPSQIVNNQISGKNAFIEKLHHPVTKHITQGKTDKSSNPVLVKYNFRKMLMVIQNETANHKSNIWLFWSKSISTLKVVSITSQVITVEVGDVLVSGVHAHVNMVQRRFLWSEMKFISDLKKPWLILGDFNAVLSIEEKKGGRTPSRRSMLDFGDCLNDCGLLQVPKIGLDFSWSNCQQGNIRVLCNLDREICNMGWLNVYSDWGYKVGTRITSNHSPLLGGCANVPKPCNALLRFQKMWLEHLYFMKLVEDSWSAPLNGDPPYVYMQKLKRLKVTLKKWNWSVFGNIQVKIKEAEEKVKEKNAYFR
ncbi:uncharacterized protein LOC113332413 [Papaver somniferum]|uniref:uncharacterized protein LOC113332413 n=1 Tax=Papaver somniferum TaxID=3469 RepID=UPI000E6F9FAF|nr:uncharacterized protein LOC113332413 [Papaver somniferum]